MLDLDWESFVLEKWWSPTTGRQLVPILKIELFSMQTNLFSHRCTRVPIDPPHDVAVVERRLRSSGSGRRLSGLATF